MIRRRYLDDFAVGDVIEHRRGHTVSEADNEMLSLLTMNTAQTHFNRASLADYFDGSFTDLPLSAPVALAIAVGLTSEDMSEHAVSEQGCTAFRTPGPIFAGDSLMVTSEVLGVDEDASQPTGKLTYRLTARVGERVVLTAERCVILKRRTPHEAEDERHEERMRARLSRLLEAPLAP